MCVVTTMPFLHNKWFSLAYNTTLYAQLDSQTYGTVVLLGTSTWGGNYTFHIIFQRCCFGTVTYPAVTVFHSSQACVCVRLWSCLPSHSNVCTFHLFICTHEDVLNAHWCFFVQNLSSRLLLKFCSAFLFLWIRIIKGTCEAFKKL